MKTKLCCLLASLILSLLYSTGGFGQVTDTTSKPRFISKNFYSKVLKENRRIHIYTPDRPKNNGNYPVLYVLDAEAMMSMVSGQVEYLSESYKIIPSMIIVGIENTDRIRDLTPTHSVIGPEGKPDTSATAFGKDSGGGDKMLQFMREELMPYINNNYPSAPYNILFGHSLGGLMAVHAMINHPGMFNSSIAASPSLQWDGQSLLKQVGRLEQTEKIKGSLFFSDANEGPAFHQNQLTLDSVLKQKRIEGLQHTYNYYPNETHISEPVKAFYDGIRFIYPEWFLNYNSSAFRKTITAKMLKDHYLKLSQKYRYNVIAPQDEINLVARMLRRDPKKINDAIELLEMNALNYPTSSTVLELLGDTFQMAGDTKQALIAYDKALHLDKNNEPVKQKIKKLNN